MKERKYFRSICEIRKIQTKKCKPGTHTYPDLTHYYRKKSFLNKIKISYRDGLK